MLPQRIAIIGAGFSGAGLLSALCRTATHSLHITLFEKTGQFGTGDAYRTPYPFHLLNVRAKDMSIDAKDPTHFVTWLQQYAPAQMHIDDSSPLGNQFVPRYLYKIYLQQTLQALKNHTALHHDIQFVEAEVVDVKTEALKACLILANGEITSPFDKVVLALGNNPVANLPFPMSSETKCVNNPWDYQAPEKIGKQETVMIVGTGLSMIDTVLTLHRQGHKGRIIAVSRHGLLPLPHSESKSDYQLPVNHLPLTLAGLMRFLRTESANHVRNHKDWRAVITAFRAAVPECWGRLTLREKKQFLRHGMHYWSIHRHRVHEKIAELLSDLMKQDQLAILSARIRKVENGLAYLKLRGSSDITTLDVDWVINCLGPTLGLVPPSQKLLSAMLAKQLAMPDEMNMGLAVVASGALSLPTGGNSDIFYTLGSLRKGSDWETGAVPEIRSQCESLAHQLVLYHQSRSSKSVIG